MLLKIVLAMVAFAANSLLCRLALKGLHMDAVSFSSLRLLNEMAQQRGQSMAQMALSWLLKDNRVTSVLIGASRPEQLEENVQSLANLTFSAEELAQIDKHVADGKLNLWQASSDK